MKELNIKSLQDPFVRFILFIVVNTSGIALLFEVFWLFWLAFYIGVVGICYVSVQKDKNQDYVKHVIILSFAFLFLLAMFSTHKHPASFIHHISSKEMYECPLEFECAKITTHIAEDDTIGTIVEVVPVQEESFRWYLIVSLGYMKVGHPDETEEFKGVSIFGVWIEYGKYF